MEEYLEVKHKPGGEVREYPTELLHREPGFVLVRFRMTRGGGPPDIPVYVPRGSISLGYFWARRPFNLYRWRDPAGEIIAHRLDAVTDVRIEPRRVRYRDLVLDWWVLPGDILLEEDRDDFERLASAGLLSPRDIAAARDADRLVHARYRHILDEASRLEHRYASESREEM
jgi:hypothetical protein